MDGGTYLEDYLMSLETLPNDVRRDFELVGIIYLIVRSTRLNLGPATLKAYMTILFNFFAFSIFPRAILSPLFPYRLPSLFHLVLFPILQMKDLDRDSIEQSKDLRMMEQSYIQKLTKNKGVEDKVALEAIDQLRNKIKQRLSEKTAIGRNLLHELDRFTRKLDTDLAFFETDLKTFGYSEQAKKGEHNSSATICDTNAFGTHVQHIQASWSHRIFTDLIIFLTI